MTDLTDKAATKSSEPDLHEPAIRALLETYWRKNVLITICLIIVWASVSLGCGILFADKLNEYTFPGTGFPLGFWFAHQGSIMVFVLLILTYCLFMNGLDAKHHSDIEKLKSKGQ